MLFCLRLHQIGLKPFQDGNLEPLYKQSNRVDGGVTPSKFSIRPRPKSGLPPLNGGDTSRIFPSTKLKNLRFFEVPCQNEKSPNST